MTSGSGRSLSTKALRRVNHLQIRRGASENTAQVETGNDDRVSPRVPRAIGQFCTQPVESLGSFNVLTAPRIRY